MDGFQQGLTRSLQYRLAMSLCVAIVIVGAAAGALSFMGAFDEAHELQDSILRQVAALIRDPSALALTQPRHWTDMDANSRLIVQRLGPDPKAHVSQPQFPATLADGLRTVELEEGRYRVLVHTLPGGERVAIAQDIDMRDEMALQGALLAVLPLAVLVPVLLVVSVSLVRRVLKPVRMLAAEIDSRAQNETQPLVTRDLPTEIRPFVRAINRLFERITQAMDSQRRFVADAAHELRSPMTALSLQAERVVAAEMSGQARERLAVLCQGIERGRILIHQLLSLMRAQTDTERIPTPVSLRQVYRSVLERLMPLAEEKNIDLGVDGEEDACIMADEVEVATLVGNLLDNAIRYTPVGGRIDLAVATSATHVILSVSDSGPGIDPANHSKVFEPFFRIFGTDTVGSGLGLAIVKTLADRMHAEVHLGYADANHQRGLRVRVLFPRIRKEQGA